MSAATILSSKRTDGWHAGRVLFDNKRPAEFFVNPSATDVRLYPEGRVLGPRYSRADALALLDALGLEPGAIPMRRKRRYFRRPA